MTTKKEQAQKTASQQPNNIPYVIAIVVMVIVGIAGVACIVALRPDSDILVVSAVVFGFIAPTTLSLLSFMKSQETHLSVNSRLEEFVRNAELAAHGKGFQEGTASANERTDSLKK